ncbi:hypothetical protein ABT352_22680 [Streptosporangium sp. NPDC000563]|uniref:Acb2/Tad1 domain-containing protein n=1 Tax=Streptosporangium sp. NPDC000563 TaxID=3154366 RepID=UPI003331054C
MHDIHDQIDDWFTFHPPASPERRDAHVAVRGHCRHLAHTLADTVPPSNELDTALWYLRQVAMWANAGLALSPDPDAPRENRPDGYGQPAAMMAGPPAAVQPGVPAALPGGNLLADPGCPGWCGGPGAAP